ncbi:GDSL-type esterase/lipase family protein [Rossellomorea sp. y25]|uniref:SGNH/GDSL hydrolase family protein n=1 Tax=Rossellomorea sp. y25 TaxID=3118174 RepID=UPI0030E48AEA
MTLQKIPTGIKFPLYEGVKLINEAIEAADKAQQDSISAKITSENALFTSQSAETKADSVQEQFNQVVIEGDSSVEAAQARVDAGGNSFPTLKDRLDTSDELLAEKLSQGNVSVADINKNLGKFDQTYMTDEFLQQMAGNTPINSVPANYSLTLKKSTYSKVVSKNLFDKSAALNGRIDGTNGSYVADSNYYTSEHIPVDAGNTLKFSANVSRYAFYDGNKNFVSGANLGTAISELVVPQGANFVRVTFYFTNLDTFIVSVGTLPASYEPYKMAIEGTYLADVDGKSLKDESISEAKTTFFELGKNIALKKYAISGKYVSSTDGTLKTNADYTVYHMIPLEELTAYAYNYDGQVALYGADQLYKRGIFGGGVAGNKTLTTNAGEVYGSFSTKETDIFQVEKGTSATSFEEPGYFVKKTSLPPSIQGEIEDVIINLPSKLYATVNEEFNVCISNILKEKQDSYNVNFECSFGKQTKDRFTGVPTTTGTKSLIIEVYERSKLVSSKTVSIIVSNPRTTPIKVLLMGDSTVRSDTNGDGIGEGLITQRLISKLGSNIQLIGTHGTAPNLWEGRGGWTAGKYRTGDSYEGVVNPFHNPSTTDFDFSYYMSNQGFSGVKVVIIQLGINDTFSPTSDSSLTTRISEVKGNFDHIINSIKAYDPNIKVALNITIPPNDSQDMFGNAYGVGQAQWRYKYNNHIWVSELIKSYQSNNDLINTHSSIDTKVNISDGVHPNTAGYNQMGDSVFSYLNSI